MAQGVRSVGKERLFNDVMEHLLDESVLGLLTADGEFGDVMSAGEANFLAVISEVFADGVDRPIVLAGAETADGIELFEAESKRVDD